MPLVYTIFRSTVACNAAKSEPGGAIRHPGYGIRARLGAGLGTAPFCPRAFFKAGRLEERGPKGSRQWAVNGRGETGHGGGARDQGFGVRDSGAGNQVPGVRCRVSGDRSQESGGRKRKVAGRGLRQKVLNWARIPIIFAGNWIESHVLS